MPGKPSELGCAGNGNATGRILLRDTKGAQNFSKERKQRQETIESGGEERMSAAQADPRLRWSGEMLQKDAGKDWDHGSAFVWLEYPPLLLHN